MCVWCVCEVGVCLCCVGGVLISGCGDVGVGGVSVMWVSVTCVCVSVCV